MRAFFDSPSSLSGTLRVPSSKSYTHRAYLTALLVEGGTVHYPLRSEDTDATLNCLEDFSATVDHDEDQRTVTIRPDSPLIIESEEIFVRESGTLLRFLIPISSVLEGPPEVTLEGEDSLSKRSNTEPINSLREAGFRVEAVGETDTVPITCYPGQQLTEEPVGVACSTTSQYLSGWLLALAGIGGGRLKRTTELVSAPYVGMTEDVLGEAGIEVSHPDSERYEVSSTSGRELDYRVPGDYSSAAFFIVGSALSEGSVMFEGLRMEDRQADSRIVPIMEDIGARAYWNENNGERKLIVEGPTKLDGFTVDASYCPDLVPVLSVLGAVGSGESLVTNVEHLTNKESDRINRTAEELRKTGVDVETGRDYLKILGDMKTTGTVELEAHGDHRLAMAFSILGVIVGNVVVDGVECVSKSYPDFFEDLRNLGGVFELTEGNL